MRIIKLFLRALPFAVIAVLLMGSTGPAGCGGGVTAAACGHHVPHAMRHFANRVMNQLGAPHGGANVASFNCWAAAEDTSASWNPLATTLPEPGSSNFNTTTDGTAHVQNYSSEGQGEQATAATLLNGNYNDLVQAFRSGGGVCGYHASFETWSGTYSSVCS
jgi:hypothetical protein